MNILALIDEWVRAEMGRIDNNREVQAFLDSVAPLALDRPHHHHGASRDKYDDGEVDDAIYYHEGHDTSHSHVFERKGERFAVGPACLLGRECEGYVPEFEG